MLRASAWKALADDRTTFDLIRNFVIEFWESEVLSRSWEVGLISILPKKGDLSLPAYLAITSSPRQEQKFFWPAFVTRLLPPRSRKSGYGLLLGCRSGFDGGREKKTFFCAFPPQKTVKSSSDGRAHLRNRSGVVELVGREPWIIARVENGVTKFSPQNSKMPKFSKNIWIRKTVFSVEFSFFGRGKTNLWGGV